MAHRGNHGGQRNMRPAARSLGSKSTTAVRTAVDSILREFCQYDVDREQWQQEKRRLEQEIKAQRVALEEKDDEYQLLLRRYKVLEHSIKSTKDSVGGGRGGVFRSGGDDVNGGLQSMMKPSNIKLKLKRRNKQMWSATLPTSLSPQKLRDFLDDFSGKFIANQQSEKKEAPPPPPSSAAAASGDAVDDQPTKSGSSPPPSSSPSSQSAVKKKKGPIISAQSGSAAQSGSKVQLLLNKTTLRHHLDCVRCLCLSDDDNVLISGSDDGAIKLWDLSKLPRPLMDGASGGSQRAPIPITFRGHSSTVSCCCIMPNSRTLITGGFDGNLFGWSLPKDGLSLMAMESLQSLRLFEMRRRDVIWDLAPHHSSAVVAAVSSDSTLSLFNVESLSVGCSLRIDGDRYIAPSAVQWNHFERERLCVATVSGHVVLFDAEKQLEIGSMAEKEAVYGINRIYSDDDLTSSLLYAACDDGRVRVFDVKSNECVLTQTVHTDSVTALALLDKAMVTASHDCRLRVWSLNRNRLSCIQDVEPQDTQPPKWDEGVLCAAFNRTRKWLFTGGAGGIHLYETNL